MSGVTERTEIRDGREFKVSVLPFEFGPRSRYPDVLTPRKPPSRRPPSTRDDVEGDTPSRKSRAPHLGALLAHVQPGRDVRPELTDEQKQALADHRDGEIARRVLRAFISARATCTAQINPRTERPEPGLIYSFPLTASCFQAVARKLGIQIGLTRSAAAIRCLTDIGLLQPHGRYVITTHVSRTRVGCYVLGCRVRGLRRAVCLKPTALRADVRKSAKRVEKPVRWWESRPGWLFGMPDGRPPPDVPRRWRSADERMGAAQLRAAL